MQIAQKRIRKTIAFPSEVVKILTEKAHVLGLSMIDYVRFLALKDAEKKEVYLSSWAEREIKGALKEYEKGDISPDFSHADEAMKWLKSKNND